MELLEFPKDRRAKFATANCSATFGLTRDRKGNWNLTEMTRQFPAQTHPLSRFIRDETANLSQPTIHVHHTGVEREPRDALSQEHMQLGTKIRPSVEGERERSGLEYYPDDHRRTDSVFCVRPSA